MLAKGLAIETTSVSADWTADADQFQNKQLQ